MTLLRDGFGFTEEQCEQMSLCCLTPSLEVPEALLGGS